MTQTYLKETLSPLERWSSLPLKYVPALAQLMQYSSYTHTHYDGLFSCNENMSLVLLPWTVTNLLSSSQACGFSFLFPKNFPNYQGASLLL